MQSRKITTFKNFRIATRTGIQNIPKIYVYKKNGFLFAIHKENKYWKCSEFETGMSVASIGFKVRKDILDYIDSRFEDTSNFARMLNNAIQHNEIINCRISV